MNYKNITLSLAILLSAFFASGQTAAPAKNIPSWKISYQLDFSKIQTVIPSAEEQEEQTRLMEMAKSLSGSETGTPPLVCYVSHDFIRVEQKGLGGGVTLADKRKTVSYLLDSTSNVATKYPLHRNNLQTQLSGDSLMVLSSKDFVMELKPDTMTIAGQLCKKAIFKNPGTTKNVITVWYAPGLPHLYWEKYSYLKQIPGCALSISTVSKGLNVGIKASTVAQVELPEKFYQLPGQYKIGVGTFY